MSSIVFLNLYILFLEAAWVLKIGILSPVGRTAIAEGSY